MAQVVELNTSRDDAKTRCRELLLEEAEAGYTEVMLVGILPDGQYHVVGKVLKHLVMVGALEYAKRDVMADNTPGAV